ncbi:MAG: hypothetical protein ACFFD2_13035 [Promethearchaeota archaeon]
MKGVLLVKFDEERGYIPIKVHPSKIRKRSNLKLFKKIARNAIGFGTDVEFQAFTLSNNSSEIHCLAKRFSINVDKARGGTELYALVLFSADNVEFPKKMLDYATQKLKAKWEARSKIMAVLYTRFNPFDESLISMSNPIEASTESSHTIFPQELFIEKEGFFAEGYTLSRNLLMLLSFIAIFWILYSNYNLFSFSFMLTIGIFVFSIIAKKNMTLKIVNGFIFGFILLLFLKLFFELIGELSTVAFMGTFPDFSRPDLALLSFISGILICFGLDRGTAIDKASFIIGICGIVFLVIFFLLLLFII